MFAESFVEEHYENTMNVMKFLSNYYDLEDYGIFNDVKLENNVCSEENTRYILPTEWDVDQACQLSRKRPRKQEQIEDDEIDDDDEMEYGFSNGKRNIVKSMRPRKESLFQTMVVKSAAAQKKTLPQLYELEEADPDTFSRMFPGITVELYNALKQRGFDLDHMTLDLSLTSCSCDGCANKFSKNGWVRELSYGMEVSCARPTLIRAFFLKSLETLETIFSRKDTCCELSFDIGMATKVLLEQASLPEGGASALNGVVLHRTCIAIVRAEMGRRLVDNKYLPVVSNSQEEITREFFKSLTKEMKEANITQGKGREYFETTVERYYTDFEAGRIDPIAWDEVVGGSKRLGYLGSQNAVFGAWGLFEGRCHIPQVIDKNSLHGYLL